MSVEDSLTRAFALADARQADFAVKAALTAGRTPEQVLSGGPSGMFSESALLGLEWEQERHLTGWVFSAIRPIAQKIASQPVRVAKKTKRPGRGRLGQKRLHGLDAPLWVKQLRDGLELVESHAILDAIDQPNPIMVRASLMEILTYSIEATGRAYWWCFPERGGTQLWPIPSSWLEPKHDGAFYTSYVLRPRIRGATFQHEIDGDEVARFYLPHPLDPFHGSMSPLQAAARAVLTDEKIQESQERFWANGIHPTHAVIVGRHPDAKSAGVPNQRPVLTAAQRTQIITAIKTAHSSAAKYGIPIILDGMIEDIKRLSNTAAELDFLQSGQLTKARIYQAFGVNPIVTGEIENANRAQAAVAEAIFLSATVNPLAEIISQWMTFSLAPRLGADDVVCWLEPARPDDPEQTRADADQLAKYGSITHNEHRALFGLPPLEGEEGDELITPSAAHPQAPGIPDQATKRLVERVTSPSLDFLTALRDYYRAHGNGHG
jgi:phage portal protein BeeE